MTNVTDALAGAVPGVTLTSNDGAPGSKSSIKIRGFWKLHHEGILPNLLHPELMMNV